MTITHLDGPEGPERTRDSLPLALPALGPHPPGPGLKASVGNSGDFGHRWRVLALGSPVALRLNLNILPDNTGPLDVDDDKRLYGRNRLNVCKWNGWGFKDTYLGMSNSTMVRLSGSRYSLCGVDMAHWHGFVDSIPGIEFTFTSPAQTSIVIPEPQHINTQFIAELRQRAPDVEVATSPEERLYHGHGHTCYEIFQLRYGRLSRLPDAVLYPKCHEDVEAIVGAATKHGVCIIPFGGGTSVALGVAVPEGELRMVATVSLSFMQKILFLDTDALLLFVEAGAVGKVLEDQLQRRGVTLGHEPDSLEFSTVGGWVATRASGMKKNAYGNIEDLVVDTVVVTPHGTLNRRSAAPRVSCGPSLQDLIIGSEGTLGIITQVLLKVKVLPEERAYGCLVFPSFNIGVAFMRHVALNKLQPASIRLMDKTQTQCGSLFRTSPPGGPSLKDDLAERLKKFYLERIRGWRESDLCACTLLFEGSCEEVKSQKRNIYDACKRFGALPAGRLHGERGYQMTFMIAYLRDFIMEHHWIFESFEASMPWPVVLVCYDAVKRNIEENAARLELKYPPIIMARLTQVYDAGAVLYFYFGFNWAGLEDPVKVYNELEHDARQTILTCGGCLSHHHGIGKLRKEFMPQAVGNTGLTLLRATKKALDPHNIFANGNLI